MHCTLIADRRQRLEGLRRALENDANKPLEVGWVRDQIAWLEAAAFWIERRGQVAWKRRSSASSPDVRQGFRSRFLPIVGPDQPPIAAGWE